MRDDKVLISAVWAFKYITDNEEFREKLEVATRESISALLFYMLDSDVHIALPAVTALKSLSKSEKYAGMFAECGAVKVVEGVFSNAKGLMLANDVCEILANLTSKSKTIVEEVLNSQLHLLVAKLLFSETNVNKDAVYLVCNCFFYANGKQLQELINEGLLIKCLGLLATNSPTTNFLILNVLKQILAKIKDCESKNTVIKQLEETGAMERIGEMCYVQNDANAKLAECILESISLEESMSF
eukprot:TRINITY_DN12297_c0_g4_i3.p1 TRINITY_DN12297_c0_g4~~TRINITY_DN12297_c0_g4_i3.p1  ORF type:complete len:243 (-),score=67.53 TRINITY_DN12297_c0_g4_i3:123-851(-)